MLVFIKYHLLGIIFLLLSLVFIGCHKNNNTVPSDISHNDSTAVLEILQDISKDYHTILDIAPIPIPDEFLNSENEYLKQIVASIEQFNKLIKNPQNIDTTNHKSVEATTYTKHCETYGTTTECIYEEDHGAYHITTDMLYGPEFIVISVYYSGIYEGVDYGEMYEIQEQILSRDCKYFSFTVYRAPVPPESAGEPLFFFSMQVMNEMSIYTPWGSENNLDVEYVSIIYLWDNFKKENHIEIMEDDRWIGNILGMTTFYWSLGKEEIYVSWTGAWNFDELTGSWCSYDDDGHIVDCGPL